MIKITKTKTKKTYLSVRIDVQSKQKITKLAKKLNVTTTDVVLYALNEALKDEKP